MPHPTIKPTPTDAVVYLNGHSPQPANPIFFTTEAEARELLADLTAHINIPNPKLLDVSYALGPVVYGQDGRRVLGIQWREVDENDVQQLREAFAGLLYWRWKELVDDAGHPTGQWRNLGDGNIGRW